MKALIIGLDGATWDVMSPLIEAGRMPNLAALAKRGTSAILDSVIPPNSPAAWSSFLTGKNPGKHGVFHFTKPAPDSMKQVPCSFRDIRSETFPSLLSKAGLTVGMVNIPMTYPPPKINGFVIPGIPVAANDEKYCHPPELGEEIASRFSGYRVDRDFSDIISWENDPKTVVEQFRALFEDMVSIEEKRVAVSVALQKEKQPDVFVVVLTLLDRLQHYFWHLGDPAHPHYSEKSAKALGNLIQEAYRLVDTMVGRLLETVEAETPVIIVSDHGFGPYHGDFYLNRWLMDHHYMTVRRVPRLVLKKTQLVRILERLKLRFLNGLLPRKVLQIPLTFPLVKARNDTGDIIWSRTRAYTTLFGLRINVKGREPFGIVEHGRDYEELLSEISRKLSQLSDRVGPIEIADQRTLYSGPYSTFGPDLYLSIAGITYVPNERLDKRKWFDTRHSPPLSGMHRIEGVFLAAGPNFARRREIPAANIQDIAPTLLYLLGFPVPKEMDGRVLVEIFQDGYVEAHPIAYDESTAEAFGGHGEDAYGAEDEERIIDSLRGLGYVD
ncbi:MAG: hypothetical protein C4520_02380 [Candidatus Abyssobacteria bacterium SURF_5]|uniref:Phosphodiesterase n=1 Tax=Abyssobacteria bacterium (strain SURF_5) TaxID=2093360 RepID=A0A3A4P2V1_ABYX5|nr:MAG: hypothetical protein C4520_02380 [Candidatus Abyssubacteria bacterium SURF_5]